MRYPAIILFLLLGLIKISARESDTVYTRYYYPNEQVSSEGFLVNGKPDGYWITYYVTGVKKSEGKRSNFMLDSIWTFYDNKGDITQKISYMIGKKNGYYITYDYENMKQGSDVEEIISKELYVNDKKEGISLYFYPDGKLKSEVSYVNGKKQGLTKEYSQAGVLETIIYFHNGYVTDKEEINRKDKEGLKQGVWKEFYEDGKLKAEYNFKDGKLNGLVKEFNAKGIMVLVMKYESDQIVQEEMEEEDEIEIRNEYDNSNRLVSSGPYKNNIQIGIHRKYNVDGSVKSAIIYNELGDKIEEGIVDEEGNRKGPWKEFYMSGELKAEGNYDDNFRSGKWIFRYKNGKIEQQGDYSRGRAIGLWRWYYDTGKLLREEYFFNGKEDGLLVEYSENGSIITQGDYVSGEKEGNWYYRVGDHIESGNYIIGLRDGIWKYFYNDSTLQFEGEFLQGNPNGKHKLYYNNGILKEERYYIMGIKEQNWKKYDMEGNIVMTITYKDDTEMRINGTKIDLPEKDRTLIK